MRIRSALVSDRPKIWATIGPIIRAGETYALDRNLSEAAALDYWMGPEKETFVAEEGDAFLGTYYLRTNQQGGGDHVCNCGYMTNTAAAGRGIARLMFDHSVARARAKGYLAMQFNFVVSANQRAVRLWQSLGFDIVGALPGAFRHPSLGFVDAYVMFKTL